MPNKEERAALFRRMDEDHSGTLSLEQMEAAVNELWPQLKHRGALERACCAAGVDQDGLVGRREFRLVLQYVLYFNRLWASFEMVREEHGQQLSLHDFSNACVAVGTTRHAINDTVLTHPRNP